MGGVIARRARDAAEQVILVGHSRGGTVISEAAELAPQAILGLVYLAALLLPAGEKAFEAAVAEDGTQRGRARQGDRMGCRCASSPRRRAHYFIIARARRTRSGQAPDFAPNRLRRTWFR